MRKYKKLLKLAKEKGTNSELIEKAEKTADECIKFYGKQQ